MRAERNDAGRAQFEIAERNDCSVRAWALAKRITYAESWAAFQAAGRTARGRTPLSVSVAVMGRSTVPPGVLSYISFLAANPVGRFVVHLRGHAIAVVDGVQLDMGHGIYKPGSVVRRYWKVE